MPDATSDGHFRHSDVYNLNAAKIGIFSIPSKFSKTSLVIINNRLGDAKITKLFHKLLFIIRKLSKIRINYLIDKIKVLINKTKRFNNKIITKFCKFSRINLFSFL